MTQTDIETAIGRVIDSFTIGDPDWDLLPESYRKQKRSEAIKDSLEVMEDVIAVGIDEYDDETGFDDERDTEPRETRVDRLERLLGVGQ